MIFTARYQRKDINDSEHYAIRTTRGAPRFRLHYPLEQVAWEIAPPREAMDCDNEDDYRAVYIRHLEAVGIDRIIRLLEQAEQRAGSRHILLMCFCGPDSDYCHRHIFAEWFEEQTGVSIPELP